METFAKEIRQQLFAVKESQFFKSGKLTLDLSNSGKEDVLLQLLVSDLLLNASEDRLDKVFLLLLTNLGFVTNPRVEY